MFPKVTEFTIIPQNVNSTQFTGKFAKNQSSHVLFANILSWLSLLNFGTYVIYIQDEINTSDAFRVKLPTTRKCLQPLMDQVETMGFVQSTDLTLTVKKDEEEDILLVDDSVDDGIELLD